MGCLQLKTLSAVLKFIDNLSIYLGKAFGFLVIPIIVLQCIEVVLRYVLNAPTVWIWELCVYLYGVMFVVGGAWVAQEGLHVRTDVLVQKMTKRQLAIIDSFLYPLLAFVFMGVMTKAQILAAVKSIVMQEVSFNAWAPPLYHFKTIIALGFVLILLQLIAHWIRSLFLAIKGVEI